MVALNSLGAIPEQVGAIIRSISQFALIGSVFSIGVVTPFAGIRDCGRTPILIAVLATAFLLALSSIGATVLPS